jgi:hypothetical protein
MELKPYQQQVINDLSLFLEHLQENKKWKCLQQTPKSPNQTLNF